MQCKDIQDADVLAFLLKHKGHWCNWCFQDDRNVSASMPPGTPKKLVLAKMTQLIRRGFVGGCYCGCRGDFEITPKGEAFLAAQMRPQ